MRLLTTVTILLCSLWLIGCAHGPKRTRPEGMPYPTKVRPGMKAYDWQRVRCMGGAAGCNSLLEQHLRR